MRLTNFVGGTGMLVRKLLILTLFNALCSLGGISLANALPITVTTSDNQIQAGVDNQGWWSNVVVNNNPTNDNYITGNSSDNFRSFFSFDLSSISGTVTSATFEVRRYLQSGAVTLSLFDVTTPAATLITTRNGVSSPSIFADLGSGTSYGSFAVATGVSTDILSFALNAAAISDINTHIGVNYFSIGGAVLNGGTIFSSSNDEPGGSFGSGANSVQRLVLNVGQVSAVPEPATLALFVAGLLGLGTMRRRHKVKT